LDSLNALPEEYLAQPKQAMKCALHGIFPAEGTSWPKIGTNSLYDSIIKDSSSFKITVLSIRPDGTLDVCMSRDDGADVSQLLRKYGFAAPISSSMQGKNLGNCCFYPLFISKIDIFQCLRIQSQAVSGWFMYLTLRTTPDFTSTKLQTRLKLRTC